MGFGVGDWLGCWMQWRAVFAGAGLLLCASSCQWLAYNQAGRSAPSPCSTIATPGCVRWDAPDPQQSLMPRGPRWHGEFIPFIMWGAEFEDESAVGLMKSHDRPPQSETRQLVALSAHRLVLWPSGVLCRAGYLKLFVLPQAADLSTDVQRVRRNLTRAQILRKAVSLPVALRRFIDFVSWDLARGVDDGSADYGVAESSTSWKLSHRGKPVRRFPAQIHEILSMLGCLPLLSWGPRLDDVEKAALLDPTARRAGLLPLLRKLRLCSLGLRSALDSSLRRKSGWDKEDLPFCPSVASSHVTDAVVASNDSLDSSHRRCVACDPCLQAFIALVHRNNRTRTAFQSALHAFIHERLLSNATYDWPMPMWSLNVDIIHEQAIGGATPAVHQIGWPQPY